MPVGTTSGWLSARAEDESSSWAITSAIYVERSDKAPKRTPQAKSACILQIANATRFIELRKQFFAHAIVTVDRDRTIDAIELIRDGAIVASVTPKQTPPAISKTPTTELRGEYETGWVWHPNTNAPTHFQGDWPVTRAGWYGVKAMVEDGSVVESDLVYFDAAHSNSHAIFSASLRGHDASVRWWGYGEEMPLADITLPFKGDHWWYPKATFWELKTVFDGERKIAGGAGFPDARDLFRASEWDKVERPATPVTLIGPDTNENAFARTFYSWLHGQRFRDPRGVFRFRDGVLHISGEVNGYLATRRRYRDYHLSLEYRWGERNHGSRIGKARDAGIFLHASGPDGNSHDGDGAFQAAIECQIMEGAVGDLMLIRGDDGDGKLIPMEITATVDAERDVDGWPTWDPEGDSHTVRTWGRLNGKGKSAEWNDKFEFRGENDAAGAAGEWTRVDVLCCGSSITVYVNGQLVNQVSRATPTEGRILLQSEGSEITVRSLRLEPLTGR